MVMKWKIAGGNDADDYPLVSVWARPAQRMYHVYSLVDGSTVAYVLQRENAELMVRAAGELGLKEETR